MNDNNEYNRDKAARDAYWARNDMWRAEWEKRRDDREYIELMISRYMKELVEANPHLEVNPSAPDRLLRGMFADYLENDGEHHKQRYIRMARTQGYLSEDIVEKMAARLYRDIYHEIDIPLMLSKCMLDDCLCGIDLTKGRW